jgi:hypothetical protein
MATMNASQAMVLVSRQNGIVVIPTTPLTRLNYFDGKFLRAQDLKLEQDYLRQLVRQSNQAGGPGVAHGFDLTSSDKGDTLNIGEGLAIDPQGRVLLLPQPITVNVPDLIDKSLNVQRAFGKKVALPSDEFDDCELHSDEPVVDITPNGNLFLIVVSLAEALCGEEDVFGKLCEEACATSTDRPYLMEGVTIRAIPFALRTALPNARSRSLSQVHLRSRVASAYFADEARRVASLISKFGLAQETWCLGADAAGGSGVAIGVLSRAGSTTIFLDPWIARRERMDPPAKRYWQWRMMMRPWDVFMAQVLQFQCQVRDLFRRIPETDDDEDPCDGARGVIHEAATTVAELRKVYEATAGRLMGLHVDPEEVLKFQGGLPRLTSLNDKLFKVGQALAARPQDEVLIRGGIVELPSAGYLPVVPGSGMTINQQVRRFMGDGVDLRFCVVRPDYVAHALEEAQHLERISLLQGLDNPKDKPEVDILVPDGELIEQKQLSEGMGFEAGVDVSLDLLQAANTEGKTPTFASFKGAARAEKLASNGGAFYLSGEFRPTLPTLRNPGLTSQPASVSKEGSITSAGDLRAVEGQASLRETLTREAFLLAKGSDTIIAGLWISLRCGSNVFKLKRGDSANFNARAIVSASTQKTPVLDVELNGVFQVVQEATATGTTEGVKGRIENAQLSFISEQFGTTGQRRNMLVNLDVIIGLTDRSEIVIILDHAQMDVQLSARWEKQPLEIRAAVVRKAPEIQVAKFPDVTFAEALLKENADVLTATNDSHVKALSALRVVASTLSDADFADAKARLLFPPPPKPIDELLVRGKMDWVLFHRRRNKKCQIDIPAPPPSPPPRRFAFWLGVATDARTAKTVNEALASGTPLDPSVTFKQVDVLEFEPGLSTMISRPGDVAADWKLTSPGPEIVHIIIASAAANDGEAIAKQREQRVAKAVSGTSQAAGATQQVVSIVHPKLATPNTDGIIVFVTLRPVATVCHSVFRAENDAILNQVRERIRAGDIPAAMKLVTPLGEVLFEKDNVVVSDPQSLTNVANQWKLKAGSAWHSAVAFSASRTPEEEKQYREQTKLIRDAIRKAMGETAVNVLPGTEPTTGTLPTSCPVFSIITVQPVASVCHSVFRARNADQFASAVKALQSMSSGEIKDVILRTEMNALGDVLFEERTSKVFGDGQSLELVNKDWQTSQDRKVLQAAVVFHASPADEASWQEQALAIATKLNGTPVPASVLTPVKLATSDVKMPTACPVFTILLPQVAGSFRVVNRGDAPVQTVCMSVYRTDSDENFNKARDEVLRLGSGANIARSVIVPNKLNLIDSPQFEGNTTSAVGDSLNKLGTNWRAQPNNGGKVTAMVLVHRKDLPPDELKAINDQASSIREILGAGSMNIQTLEVDKSLVFPTDCRAFLIVLAL